MSDGRNKREFHTKLENEMSELAHLVYRITRSFPAEEKFGVISQLRRAALSVPFNYREGYARRKPQSHKYFLEIAYGSLKETTYLLTFCYDEGFINEVDYNKAFFHADTIGKMLWGTLEKISKKTND